MTRQHVGAHREDVEALLDELKGLRLPSHFDFGVSTSAYQTEGGYNGPDEPRNNWYEWELKGRIERSGIATDSWRRFADDVWGIERAGCDTYNFTVEWARVQPSAENNGDEPAFDLAAIDRYAQLIATGRAHGIEPIVTLQHFTHPRWLGLDFWRRSDSPEVFAAYVASVVPALNRRLVAKGQEPVARWLTLAELNVLASETWITGIFPGGGFFHPRIAAQTLDNLLASHVLAYDAIHDVYEASGWPSPQVSTNNFSFATYEIDQALTDILLARRRGVDHADLWPYLLERRRRWYSHVAELPGPSSAKTERILRRLATRVLSGEVPATLSALYASKRADKLDAIAFDFYDPWLAGRLRAPWRRTNDWRVGIPVRPQWEDPSRADTLVGFSRLIAEDTDRLPLWIVENGMCNRVYQGRSLPRSDGLTRPRYLLDHVTEIARAVSEGIPITCYVYWTLYDNYEWGSFQPRYGLYGIDRDRGCERLERDSLGDDSARAYRAIIEAVRGIPAAACQAGAH